MATDTPLTDRIAARRYGNQRQESPVVRRWREEQEAIREGRTTRRAEKVYQPRHQS